MNKIQIGGKSSEHREPGRSVEHSGLCDLEKFTPRPSQDLSPAAAPVKGRVTLLAERWASATVIISVNDGSCSQHNYNHQTLKIQLLQLKMTGDAFETNP